MNILFNKTGLDFSPRQQQCISLLLKGENTKSIALELNLSPRTIEKYIETIKARLSARNIAELLMKLMDLVQG